MSPKPAERAKSLRPALVAAAVFFGLAAVFLATHANAASHSGRAPIHLTSGGLAALDHFAVEAAGGGPIGSVTAGDPVQVQITAEDADGNPVTDFQSSVDITSNNPSCTGCYQDVGAGSWESGVLLTTVRLTQAGAGNTIGVNVHDFPDAYPQSGTSDPFTVTASELLNDFKVEKNGGGTIGSVAAGSSVLVQITAEDP